MNYNGYTSNASITTAIVIPLYNNSICTFKYTQTSNNKLVSFQKTAFYGRTNEISFDPNEVLLLTNYHPLKISALDTKDFRIFVSCSEEIKLIARYSDLIETMGDIYNVFSIKNSGNKYIFEMPTQRSSIKGFIGILPITQSTYISVNILGYLNGEIFSNETIQYDTTFSTNQRYIAISPLDIKEYNSSIIISATSNFMLTFASPFITESNFNYDACGDLICEDYTAFMLMPVVSKECNIMLRQPDQKIMRNDFTTRLYVSPPSVDNDCNESFSMDVYDENNNVKHELISAIGSSTIELTDKSEMGSSTSGGQIPMFRLGRVINSPGSPLTYGHFGHFVPSIREWVVGKTQFYTLATNCIIEFYADQDGYNPEFIKLDGIVISNYNFNYMNYFKKKYGHFTIPVKGYGLHTFENWGNYVLYVICKNVNNNVYDSAGYVASFNQKKGKR
uniref:IgGFc_binding domain-containing protein n=1 Tax=Rhabditophanes sp. KR3021 TaxID=114890 RepID=A0AC35TLI2_9BILA